MIVEIGIAASVFALGFAFGAVANAEVEDVQQNKTSSDDTTSKGWAVYVEATSNPTKYKGVYEAPTHNTYEVVGTGITNTLRDLADEIDS